MIQDAFKKGQYSSNSLEFWLWMWAAWLISVQKAPNWFINLTVLAFCVANYYIRKAGIPYHL